LEAALENLRAALHWFGSCGAVEEGLRLASALLLFWTGRDHVSDGDEALTTLLASPRRGRSGAAAAAAAAAVRANALNAGGWLAFQRLDIARARALHEEALAIGRAIGEQRIVAVARLGLGNQAEARARFGEAMGWYQASRAGFEALGEPWGLAWAIHGLGRIALTRGDPGARTLLEQCLAIRRRMGDLQEIPGSLHRLAEVAHRRGEVDTALRLYEESLEAARAVRRQEGIAWVLEALSEVLLERGEVAAADARCAECLAIRRRMGDADGAAIALRGLGDVARARGDLPRARALYEESLAIRRISGHRNRIAAQLLRLGELALDTGDHGAVREAWGEALSLFRDLQFQASVAYMLERFAGLLVVTGQPARAFRLAGAADALRASAHVPRTTAEAASLERALDPARRMVSAEEASIARAAGRAMATEAAVADALDGGPAEVMAVFSGPIG
jgi:tetratricopeptide (TPR) repeat protein